MMRATTSVRHVFNHDDVRTGIKCVRRLRDEPTHVFGTLSRELLGGCAAASAKLDAELRFGF